MKTLLARVTERLLKSNPIDVEAMVRGLVIQFHFHTSDRGRIEVFGEGRKTLNVLTPTTFKGLGKIRLGQMVVFGEPQSPGGFSSSYIEARGPASCIEIGAGTTFNNRATLISEGASITFGERCLIGPEVYVTDTNSHQMEVAQRSQPDANPQPVCIGNDVFIGVRVTILKGARIGNGCVVSAGSVVPPMFQAPDMSIVAGNPARIVGRVKSATPAKPASAGSAPSKHSKKVKA